jgi:glycosyltransferase involved in cell wall biosynthesis
MSSIEFSIIIPLHNKSSSVEHTVKSVIAQTWQDYELIIVNDGSTDGSDQVFERISDNG